MLTSSSEAQMDPELHTETGPMACSVHAITLTVSEMGSHQPKKLETPLYAAIGYPEKQTLLSKKQH